MSHDKIKNIEIPSSVDVGETFDIAITLEGNVAYGFIEESGFQVVEQDDFDQVDGTKTVRMKGRLNSAGDHILTFAFRDAYGGATYDTKNVTVTASEVQETSSTSDGSDSDSDIPEQFPVDDGDSGSTSDGSGSTEDGFLAQVRENISGRQAVVALVIAIVLLRGGDDG